jgi:hypothetical protein
MLSNLVTIALLLVALAAAACFSAPDAGAVVCRDRSHRGGVGEIVYCRVCDKGD